MSAIDCNLPAEEYALRWQMAEERVARLTRERDEARVENRGLRGVLEGLAGVSTSRRMAELVATNAALQAALAAARAVLK